ESIGRARQWFGGGCVAREFWSILLSRRRSIAAHRKPAHRRRGDKLSTLGVRPTGIGVKIVSFCRRVRSGASDDVDLRRYDRGVREEEGQPPASNHRARVWA